MKNLIIETNRLYLRKIEPDDIYHLTTILGDPEVMYAWEHAFTDSEIEAWIEENLKRYERDGFSYWAVIQKSDGLLGSVHTNEHALIGVAGLLSEKVDDEPLIGLGYVFAKKYWNQGFALECGRGCLNYARHSGIKELTAQIRPNNQASIKLAEKLGFKAQKEFTKIYKNKQIPHILYHALI